MKKLCFLLLLISGLAFGNELVHYTRPAERERGASFADGFESQARVESNGGTVYGSPTFSASQGVTLNGSNDYIQYDLTGQEFFSSELSILIEFTPDFDWDNNSTRAIYYGDSYFYIVKTNNGGGNKLNMKIHNSFYSILPAAYSSYWKTNQKNILIISAESGSEKIWLNGEVIATASTSYTVRTVLNLYIGASNTGVQNFDGIIHRIVVFHAKLSDAECEAYSNGTMWNYENRAVAVWRFRAADHTGTTTKESAGRGYDLTINGSPEKLQTHGYEFDGSSDYLSRADDDTFDPAGDFSVQCVVENDDLSSNAAIISRMASVTSEFSWRVQYINTNELYLSISKNGTAWSQFSLGNAFDTKLIAFTMTYNYVADGSSVGKIYVGSRTAAESTTLAGPVYNSTAALMLAARGGPGGYFDGSIYYCAYFNEVLNEMQHLDFMIRERHKMQEQ